MSEQGIRIGPVALDRRELTIHFGFAFVVLLAVYSATLIYPYLLSDETWIIRPGGYKTTAGMGRPLFSVLALWGEKIRRWVGLDVIYVMRVSAVAALAMAAVAMSVWLRMLGHERRTALVLCVALMTLPAFQIVVADGTQLAFAILAAVLAVVYLAQRTVLGTFISAVLIGVALTIYQQQALVAFALLAIPLIDGRTNRDTYIFTIGGGVLICVVTVAYYVMWKLVYRLFFPGMSDLRYGPDAVSIPTVDQMKDFAVFRLSQIGELWLVAPPTWRAALPAAILVAIAVVVMFWKRGPLMILNLVLLLGFLVACDSFALVARNYHSYVTATALSLMVGYWAFAGLSHVVPARFAAPAVLLAGSIAAFITVRDEIAYPNWQHIDTMRKAIVSNPAATSFHIVGRESGNSFQEFAWRNSATDLYVYAMAMNIVDDLVKRRVFTREHRDKIYVSVTGMQTRVAQHAVTDEKREPAVTITLD